MDPRRRRARLVHTRPLEDVRVVAVEQYGAGPFGSLHFAELGADVIKVEDARSGGDVARYVPPYQEGEDSLFFESLNRNKRSVCLDLRTAAGRQVLLDLIAISDAVYSNLRGDGPEHLGIRYEDLRATNRRIVCCNLSGFGQTGPRRQDAAYDYVIQALTGWMSVTGDPDGPPTKSGLSLVDFAGGYVAALSMLVGIHAARRDGVGMDCDVSLFDVGISMLNYQATWHLTEGFLPARTRDSAHPSLVPFQNFPTRDGWITVCCPNQKFWALLCEALGRPELADDPRFVDFEARRRNREELIATLTAVLAARTTTEWLETLGAAGVPVAPVNTIAEALRDEQTAARGLVIDIDHPRFGSVGHVRSAVRAGPVAESQRRAPHRHEHADEVLTGLLGYSPERRAQLDESGAFGAPCAVVKPQETP